MKALPDVDADRIAQYSLPSSDPSKPLIDIFCSNFEDPHASLASSLPQTLLLLASRIVSPGTRKTSAWIPDSVPMMRICNLSMLECLLERILPFLQADWGFWELHGCHITLCVASRSLTDRTSFVVSSRFTDSTDIAKKPGHSRAKAKSKMFCGFETYCRPSSQMPVSGVGAMTREPVARAMESS